MTDTAFGTMSLGALIKALEAAPPERSVHLGFKGIVPDSVDSYRGYYDHLAIGFHAGDSITIADLLEMLRGANGGRFEGYKGGTYRMGEETPVWVANYGESPENRIVGVAVDDYSVTIKVQSWAGDS